MNTFSEVLPVDAFNGISGKSFLYPSAGSDWEQPFRIFAPYVDEFIFADIGYQFSTPKPMSFEGWDLCSSDTRLTGPATDQMRCVQDSSSRYRDIHPAWLKQTFKQQGTGKTVTVTRRRGFGQYAIDELPNASLGVFLHRGDSMGEGGSGVFYFGNKRLEHPPLNRIFDNLKRKLAFPALIASDGSNSKIMQLRVAARDAQSDLTMFSAFGLRWTLVARIPWHIGDTVLWRVTLESPQLTE